MPKYTNDLILDAPLDKIIAEGNLLVICAGAPTTFTNAQTDAPTGNRLGQITLSAVDFTKANGDLSGRKVTVAGKTGISITAGGTADHAVILDTVNSRIVHYTEITAQAVTSGATSNTNAFDIEFGDPS